MRPTAGLYLRTPTSKQPFSAEHPELGALVAKLTRELIDDDEAPSADPNSGVPTGAR
jgi:hypothetical protein